MANGVLVDSCYFIGRTRAGLDPFAEILAADEVWEPVTCGVVALEVLRGVKHQRVFAEYRDVFGVMMCVPTTSHIWASATDILRDLAQRGFTIPAQDAVIAACALSVDIPVLTFDAHFAQIPGLTVIDTLA